jgi:hypothetical protein
LKTRSSFAKAAVFAALVSGSSFAFAAGNTTVQVTATVSAVCKFSATSFTAIALGTIDPSTVSSAPTGTRNVTYACTKNTTPVVAIVSGGTTLAVSGDATKTIPYTFALGTPETGVGFTAGAAGSKVLGTATITQANAQDAQAGSYTDTVTLSIDN